MSWLPCRGSRGDWAAQPRAPMLPAWPAWLPLRRRRRGRSWIATRHGRRASWAARLRGHTLRASPARRLRLRQQHTRSQVAGGAAARPLPRMRHAFRARSSRRPSACDGRCAAAATMLPRAAAMLMSLRPPPSARARASGHCCCGTRAAPRKTARRRRHPSASGQRRRWRMGADATCRSPGGTWACSERGDNLYHSVLPLMHWPPPALYNNLLHRAPCGSQCQYLQSGVLPLPMLTFL